MRFCFIIVEDELENVAHLRSLLSRLDSARWPDVHVWPSAKGRKTFRDWNSAWNQVLRLTEKGWDPENDCCILLLDIALGRDAASIEKGIDAITPRLNSQIFRKYVRIAWTKYADSVGAKLGGQLDFNSSQESYCRQSQSC